MLDEKLKKVFKDKYNIEITSENEDMFFDLLGINSLELVNLIMYIEEALDVDFYSINVDLMKLKTYNRIKNVIIDNFMGE